MLWPLGAMLASLLVAWPARAAEPAAAKAAEHAPAKGADAGHAANPAATSAGAKPAAGAKGTYWWPSA